jgi:hypothetical protein
MSTVLGSTSVTLDCRVRGDWPQQANRIDSLAIAQGPFLSVRQGRGARHERPATSAGVCIHRWIRAPAAALPQCLVRVAATSSMPTPLPTAMRGGHLWKCSQGQEQPCLPLLEALRGAKAWPTAVGSCSTINCGHWLYSGCTCCNWTCGIASARYAVCAV